jgi:hypothetical protein
MRIHANRLIVQATETFSGRAWCALEEGTLAYESTRSMRPVDFAGSVNQGSKLIANKSTKPARPYQLDHGRASIR